jgi:hypothetical protein
MKTKNIAFTIIALLCGTFITEAQAQMQRPAPPNIMNYAPGGSYSRYERGLQEDISQCQRLGGNRYGLLIRAVRYQNHITCDFETISFRFRLNGVLF